MAESTDSPESKEEAMKQELEKKITDAFNMFDHEANRTVDVRDVGTIMRSLGCCPSEADVKEIVSEIEDQETTGYVQFDKFLPMMTNILLENKFPPATDDELLMAFEVLDVDHKGYMLKEELTTLMTQEGEPFTEGELEDMMSHAVDTETGHIPYRKYAFTLNPIDEL